jgi:RNA polymerase sigma-70 factor (ECF subfamily)
MSAVHTSTEAFERFFLAEHSKLIALGLAWTGNRETAGDLAQEALTRAYRQWSMVGLLDLPGAWVRRVMINLLIDHRRDAERRSRLVDRLDRPQAAPEPSPQADAWWDAVRALPDRERAAVTLHYIEDLSIAEVAGILEVQPGTVKASLSHARDKLRTALSPTTPRGDER